MPIQNSFFNIHSHREPIDLRRDTNDVAFIEKQGDTYFENKQFERAIVEYRFAKKVIKEQIDNVVDLMDPAVETSQAINTIEQLMAYRDKLYERLDKKIENVYACFQKHIEESIGSQQNESEQVENLYRQTM